MTGESAHLKAFALILAVTALGGLTSCAGTSCNPCNNEPSAADKAKDAAARVEYWENAAKTYYEGGKYQQSVAMWDKVLAQRPEDQWAKFGLAKSLQMIGTVNSLRRAEAVLTPIMGLQWMHPTRGDVSFELKTTMANIYSDLADYYDRDIRAIEVRLENDGGANTKVLQQQMDRQKIVRDRLLRKSIPLWHEVLSTSPENPSALAGLAKANLVAGSESSGIHYAERYIRLSQKSQKLWKQRLDEWVKMKQGQIDRDDRAFYLNKIHGAREKEIGMILLLGSVYMRQENFSKAVDAYDKVLKIDPARVAALVERAQGYAALGMYPEAVTDLEQYLKLTDPQRHRQARINAADLLDRYRQIVARTPTIQPTARPAAASPRRGPASFPAPRSAPAPVRVPSDRGYGNPDR